MSKVKPVSEAEIAEALRARISYRLSQTDLAKELGISHAHLSEVLSGKKRPGPRVLKAMGYDPTPYYCKAGAQ